jgi:hypothetical protein
LTLKEALFAFQFTQVFTVSAAGVGDFLAKPASMASAYSSRCQLRVLYGVAPYLRVANFGANVGQLLARIQDLGIQRKEKGVDDGRCCR